MKRKRKNKVENTNYVQMHIQFLIYSGSKKETFTELCVHSSQISSQDKLMFNFYSILYEIVLWDRMPAV